MSNGLEVIETTPIKAIRVYTEHLAEGTDFNNESHRSLQISKSDRNLEVIFTDRNDVFSVIFYDVTKIVITRLP